MMDGIDYRTAHPPPHLSPFVESCWMLISHTNHPQDMIILPDGRVDVSFSSSPTEPFNAMLMGLQEQPERVQFPPGTRIFAVSLKLPAVEYLLRTNISAIFNSAAPLPDHYWGITADDLQDFDQFCTKAFAFIANAIDPQTDNRKIELFDLIYRSHGSMPVKELSARTFWSSRQINRYFNQQFGLSLKSYCSILRFRASFPQIREGRLFPEEAFTDQSHFIRNVKKYAGVAPKALHRNQNDLFIQFSTLPKE